MKFHNLKINNFCSISELELPLNNQGLVLILGKNEDAPKADSNGAGKSLPLDAFTWCLWGRPVRTMSTDEVVNDQVGKDCFVEVEFSEGESVYTVRRCRNNKRDQNLKPNDLVFLCNGEDASGVSIADTQERINSTLGLDVVTFCAMMPGASVKVSEMTDSEIKSLLEKILQTEILGDAHEKVRADLKDVQSDLRVAETSKAAADSAVLELQQRIAELSESYDSFEDNKEKKILNIQSRIGDILEEMEKHDKTLQKAVGVEDKLKDAKQRLRAAEEEQKELYKQEEKLKSEFNKKNLEWIGMSEAVRSRSKVYEEAKKTLESLESECPSCKQSVSQEHKLQVMEELDSKIKIQLAKCDVLTQQNANLLVDHQKEIKPIDDAKKKARSEEALASKDIEKLRVLQNSAQTALTLKERAREGIEQLKSEQEAVQSEVNPFGSLVKDAKNRLEVKTKESDDLQEKVSVLASKEKVLQYWLTGFSPSGLRSFMLEHVTPVLNSAAKKYSDILTDGEMEVTFHTKDILKNGKSKERFNIKVKQAHGGSSYGSNSKGEQARANLVIALALGDLAAMRANKVVPFRFLDEPFESVDESGTDAIVNLLNMHRDTYDTVFVITHKEDFKQLFSNKRLIVKKNGFSTWGNLNE